MQYLLYLLQVSDLQYMLGGLFELIYGLTIVTFMYCLFARHCAVSEKGLLG